MQLHAALLRTCDPKPSVRLGHLIIIIISLMTRKTADMETCVIVIVGHALNIRNAPALVSRMNYGV